MIILFVLIAALTACTKQEKNLGAVPVLIVNGITYSAKDFGHDLAKKLKNFDALAAKEPLNVHRAKEEVLNDFIVSTLLLEYAREHHIDVADSEVTQEFDRVRKGYPDDLTFKAGLAGEGETIDEWRAHLKKSLLEKKVFSSIDPVDDKLERSFEQQAKDYYDKHKPEFNRPAQVHLQQIVVAKEDDAERLLHKLKSGASFSDLAKKFSVSPDGAQGGDVGYVSKGVIPAFDAAFDLRPGQLSGVIKSSYGFHIMKVLDKRTAGPEPYEKAKKALILRIRAQHQQQAFNSWLDAAVKSAHTERNDAAIEKVKIRTEGEQE